ncbi:hypothetical protein EJ05DRAFT_539215 [Pseudovirgaria hyperparasitica]|uniref:J domain-containing protein n=1 Tax=Pseudovirgaria hyperparasitica TaxID=470096 RepID=A0A6A6W6G6_9PEZI|nr:uncharacterized protein EJ05DRAFT_539215 [Pseudovirgaria hyperparasitica]KAF2757157.1 hypothetical protein EJ05DRAFT_539215 [Pseudovirgaria hyperparasitica]
MSTDYNYDDQAQFFPYFILTISALVAIPTTYSVLKPSKELADTATRIEPTAKVKYQDVIEGHRKVEKRKELKTKRIWTAVLAWSMIAYMFYLIMVTARTALKIWDPYDVLGVARSATEKQIKSHYRRLSLTYHPDKAQPDASKNTTIESINEQWVEMTKAFKALTDEEIRNNYLQYGHPDGKQSFSMGIALPKFIVSDGNGKYVLLIYGLLLGVLLPYFVGRWWYGQQKRTRDKVLVASAGHLFKEYDHEITEGGVINALSSGQEYQDMLEGSKADHGISKLEQRILAPGQFPATAAGLSLKDRKKLEELDEGARRKALALLWAYLGRIELDDKELVSEQYQVAPTARLLNQSFVSIALAYMNTAPLLAAYHASQHIIQAIPPGGSPLLQLPYFTPDVVRSIEGAESRTHLTVQGLLELSDAERRIRCVSSGALSKEQYNTSMAVASQLPLLKVESAFFKVVGERFITPSSLVQFVVKARFVPPGKKDLPPVDPKELEDPDPVEGDLDALHGRKKEDKEAEAGKPIQPPLAYAPYFAQDHAPQWHVFLADSKQGKIVVPPFSFSTFNKPLFDKMGEPSYAIQTLKMQFGAPPQVGRYTFTMNLVCDSYIGMDTRQEVTLVIDEASKAQDIVEEEDISEPEEDSIAGQVSALKGDHVPRKKKPAAATAEDSDDESGTDEEDDVSETDTDTDTDDE